MIVQRLLLTFAIGLCASTASAKVFDFKSAGFGTFFRGEYGLSQRGDASFADSSGTSVFFDTSRSSNAGGEFGLLWADERTTFRISAEVLIPKRLSGVSGSSSSGTKYYDLDSKVTVFIPQANLEFIVMAMPESRILYSIGGGVAWATTQNIYKFTPAGTAQFAGLADHTETGKGQGLDIQTSVAYEFEFADHATLIADLGYRYLRINELKSSEDVTTFSGTYHAGDTLKNNNGGDRSLDLGGVFAGLGFRFYF